MEDDPPNEASRRPVGTLRQRASEIVALESTDTSSMAECELQRLVYELQIHQVELELQNQELREAQLALASSRDQFAELYNFAPVAYLTLDSSGVIVDCNITASSLLGVARENLLESKFSRFVAPSSQDTSYLYWKSLFSGAKRQVCELQMHRADRNSGWVRMESISVKSLHNAEMSCRVAIVDIEDVVQARRQLQSLNAGLEERVLDQLGQIELLARALAGIHEGVIITSDHSNWLVSLVVFVNDAACQMLGVTPETAIGETPETLLVRNGIDSTDAQRIQEQLEARESLQTEQNYSRSDGNTRKFELSVSPIFDEQSQRTNYVLLQRDITERHLEKQLLHDREVRLQAILDTVPDAILTIDREGIVQSCNPAVEPLFGFTVAELSGRNISCLMPSPYRDEHDTYLRRYRETGESHIVGSTRRLVAQHRDGHVFPINLSVNEIDHLGLYLGIVHNVSELDHLQRQVLKASDEVQWRIGQSLHDGPRQVLAGLSLMAKSLQTKLQQQESPLEYDVGRLLTGLREAGGNIRRLARGLLPVSNVNDDLAAALHALAEQCTAEYGINCEFVCSGRVKISDRYTIDQLYHIAQEAVLNAITHSGSTLIQISLERSGQTLSLRISDNGTGLDSHSQVISGLGLYIMPYRAATIGAELTISPAEHGGTVVNCTLIDIPTSKA